MIDVAKTMFTSEQDIDKIVRIFIGSFQFPAQTVARVGFATINVFAIPHGLGRPVACEMQWAVGKQDWVDNGSQDDNFQGSLAYSDSTNIYIISPLFVGSGTVFYRVWCSWINDYDATNPLIDVLTYSDTPLVFDSRSNFQKIFKQDVLTFSAGTFGSPQNITVDHNFGFTPNAKVWFEPFAGEVWPLNSGGNSNLFLFHASQDECELRISNTNIEVRYRRFSNAVRKAWYKIYYDES